MQPNVKWSMVLVNNAKFEILSVSDSDYAKDVGTRRINSGFAVYFNNAVWLWCVVICDIP